MPAATRIGDADVPHCSGMTRAVGSPNVFVNNIPWSRQGDVNTGHLLPGWSGGSCPQDLHLVYTLGASTGVSSHSLHSFRSCFNLDC